MYLFFFFNLYIKEHVLQRQGLFLQLLIPHLYISLIQILSVKLSQGGDAGEKETHPSNQAK